MEGGIGIWCSPDSRLLTAAELHNERQASEAVSEGGAVRLSASGQSQKMRDHRDHCSTNTAAYPVCSPLQHPRIVVF